MRTKFTITCYRRCSARDAIGIWLDERIAESAKDGRRRLAATAVLALGAACVVALVGRDFSTSVPLSSPGGGARLMHLFTYRYTRMWPSVTAWGPVFAPSGCSVRWARSR